MKKKILVFDDLKQTAQSWADKLASVPAVKSSFASPDVIGPDEFQDAILTLNNRRKAARKQKLDEYSPITRIDQADVFLIDFDLLELNQITYITGEEVAYLVRCYSRCGLIIGINQFRKYGDNLFDLTLKGHPDSFADLNLTSTHLSNGGLWKEPWKGFRPWYWPLLPIEVEAHEARINDVVENPNVSILEFLGLAPYKPVLSRAALEFLEVVLKVGRISAWQRANPTPVI